MTMKYFSNCYFLILSCLVLASCGGSKPVPFDKLQDGAPTHNVDIHKIPNQKPKPVTRSRYGNPDSYEVFGKRYYLLPTRRNYSERGIASWYGTKFHGRRTSSGEPFDMFAMTAAHKSLPIPVYARVTNLENGKEIIVKINDRGPFKDNRIIDLSYVAAKKLGIFDKGTGLVEVTTFDPYHTHDENFTETYQTAQAADIPEALPAPEQLPKLFLQVGSFGNYGNAQRLSNQLKNLTAENIIIESINLPNSQIHRVQIGPLASIEQSDSLQQILQNSGFGESITVVK